MLGSGSVTDLSNTLYFAEVNKSWHEEPFGMIQIQSHIGLCNPYILSHKSYFGSEFIKLYREMA